MDDANVDLHSHRKEQEVRDSSAYQRPNKEELPIPLSLLGCIGDRRTPRLHHDQDKSATQFMVIKDLPFYQLKQFRVMVVPS